MKERLSKLLTVKSIVTIALTGVFATMALTNVIDDKFLVIYTTIIAFYFGTQTKKGE